MAHRVVWVHRLGFVPWPNFLLGLLYNMIHSLNIGGMWLRFMDILTRYEVSVFALWHFLQSSPCVCSNYKIATSVLSILECDFDISSIHSMTARWLWFWSVYQLSLDLLKQYHVVRRIGNKMKAGAHNCNTYLIFACQCHRKRELRKSQPNDHCG